MEKERMGEDKAVDKIVWKQKGNEEDANEREIRNVGDMRNCRR